MCLWGGCRVVVGEHMRWRGVGNVDVNQIWWLPSLAQADLDPWTFVMCGRVTRVWRRMRVRVCVSVRVPAACGTANAAALNELTHSADTGTGVPRVSHGERFA